MNKEALAQQIKDMEAKLAEMKAELEKPEPTVNYWQPEYRENYYYVEVWGSIRELSASDNTPRYRIFKTLEQAEYYADYVKAEEALKKEIAILNEGWVPDWQNHDQAKYSFSLVPKTQLIQIECNSNSKFHDSFIYLKSLALAGKLITSHRKELITYLSY